jgi:hypothetical protein
VGLLNAGLAGGSHHLKGTVVVQFEFAPLPISLAISLLRIIMSLNLVVVTPHYYNNRTWRMPLPKS